MTDMDFLGTFCFVFLACIGAATVVYVIYRGTKCVQAELKRGRDA